MKTKKVMCLRPEDLVAEINFIIATDNPTFMQVVEMQSARTHFIIIWR